MMHVAWADNDTIFVERNIVIKVASLTGAAYLERPLSASVAASFADVRLELAIRLDSATRPFAADLSADELTGIVQVFSDIGNMNTHSGLPSAIRDYAQELVDAIDADNFEALDPDSIESFPNRISPAEYLAELKSPVEELALLQTDKHWINYETIGLVVNPETQRSIEMSVRQITSKELENQASVLLHEQD